MDNTGVGKKLIASAIKIDESLADLLKVETQKIKKLLKTDTSTDTFKNSNLLLRNIIFALLLTDEKIQYGIDLLNKDDEK